MMDRDTVRAILLANGFEIKEGQTDLKEYVYSAVSALLSHVAATEKTTQVQLRDYLAAKAMHCALTAFHEENRQRSIQLEKKMHSDLLTGKCNSNLYDSTCPFDETWRTGIAMDAYLMADVMLKVREVDLTGWLAAVYSGDN